MNNYFNTPILLITFNRPNHTRRVWDEIKKQKPKYFFVFQDGARDGNVADIEKCANVRAVFEEPLDWDCEFKTYYSDVNLGCGPGPAKAITWFFKNVEQGIIFEDDCLPSQSLFRFFEELLIQYRDNDRIGLITGTNLLSKWGSDKSDYFFCKIGGATMGSWASWRRAWKFFDYNMESWGDRINKIKLKKNMGSKYYKTFSTELDMFYDNGQTHAWDYQWAYARLLNEMFSIVSSVNQMSNIGFGDDGTHTFYANDRRSNMPIKDISFPLKSPQIKRDKLFDFVVFYRFNYRKKKSVLLRIVLKIIEFTFSK